MFDAGVLFVLVGRVFRYNKEMLGKHMWKFPAPFLMNTVHFTMQAVASRVIVWFQHRGLEGAASAMTWRDYFLRGDQSVAYFMPLDASTYLAREVAWDWVAGRSN
jgi:hypothetical protein